MNDYKSEERGSWSANDRLRRLLKVLDAIEVAPRRRLVQTEEDFSWKWESERGPIRPESLVVRGDDCKVATELVARIEKAMERIAKHHLTKRIGGAELDRLRRPVWTLGSIVYVLGDAAILRGSIQKRKTEPICVDIPDAVVQYLVNVPGTRDQITRESHGHWGYHYHYLDDKSRRSDTLLTFNALSGSIANPDLCWERHAEKSGFKAKAGSWGTEKRQSVYSVCQPDAHKVGLKHFKRPGADAKIVWPPPVPLKPAPSSSGAKPLLKSGHSRV